MQEFPNIPNFRDLGGFPAAGGRTTRRGLVFRADDLSAVDDEELARLEELNLRCIVDFRSRQETLCAPDIVPSTVRRAAAIPVDAGKLIGNAYGGTLNRRKSTGIMISVYRQLARDFAQSYRQFFEILADPENVPLLFHCTAGKDRTGVAAALFLSALGVERKLIVEDYLRSAECLRKKYVKGVDYDEAMEPLYTVYPEFIAAAFEVADAAPGGTDGYLRDALGVDIEHMRKTFTE